MKLSNFVKKATAVTLAVIMALVTVISTNETNFKASAAGSTVLTGKTAQEITAMMGLGWNLGNTFDATGGTSVSNYETNWGNPKVTKTLIDGVKAAGFDTIRIPVTWYRAMQSTGAYGKYTINPAYLARVKEIVDYAYANDMFVILNIHHENWLNNKYLVSNQEAIASELEMVWEQIADYFADYDQHLIFEGMNEPRYAGASNEWSGDAAGYRAVYYYSQVFVNTVRENGKGYNSERCLMIPGYAASSNSNILDATCLPTYKGEYANNLIVSVHCYQPYNFCLSDTSKTFSDTKSSDTAEINRIFEQLNKLFLSKGISVVIGETGATNTGNNTAERAKWAKYMGKMSTAYGVPIVIWDNGVTGTSGGECHDWINRNTGKASYPTIMSALIEGAKSVTWRSSVTAGSSTPSTGTGSVILSNPSGISIPKAWNAEYVVTQVSASDFNEGGEIQVVYTGSGTMHLIVVSDSKGAYWIDVKPSKVDTKDGKKVAHYTVSDIKTATANDPKKVALTDLSRIQVCSDSTDSTVYEISSVGGKPTVTYIAFGNVYASGASLPADPYYDGFVFQGWYTTMDYKEGTELNLSTLTSSTNAYAKFLYGDENFDVDVSYRTHVQSYGWQAPVKNGKLSGTTGEAKRLEGIEISLDTDKNLGIQYTTHVQTYGWLNWSKNGEMSGTTGEAKRLEAIEIRLIGSDKDNYDVFYRVHAQSYGWLNWAKNGEPSGTSGYAKRLEGIQILVLPKGETPSQTYKGVTSANKSAYVNGSGSTVVVPAADEVVHVVYQSNVESIGWQKPIMDGATAGTSGKALKLQGIKIDVRNKDCTGGVMYRSHVQSTGWETKWRQDGEISGNVDAGKRLEALQLKLYGEMADKYDIYYRVHVQRLGWLGWAKNGASAGSSGFGYRIEAIEIKLVAKGGSAPGKTTNCYVSN